VTLTEYRICYTLQGHVEVLAPARHRAANITHDGGFSMMLAPDTVYCLAIHPQDPHNTMLSYEVIRVAILHLGGGSVMASKGLDGLTQQAEFHAVRHTAHPAELDGSQQDGSRPPSRRMLQTQSRSGRDVALIGQATPDMCWFGERV